MNFYKSSLPPQTINKGIQEDEVLSHALSIGIELDRNAVLKEITAIRGKSDVVPKSRLEDMCGTMARKAGALRLIDNAKTFARACSKAR